VAARLLHYIHDAITKSAAVSRPISVGSFSHPQSLDGGSARVLAGLGFEALPLERSIGGDVSQARRSPHSRRSLASARAIAAASTFRFPPIWRMASAPIPMRWRKRSAAAENGLVGCSIEDSTGDANHPLYEIEFAAERIASCGQSRQIIALRFNSDCPSRKIVRGSRTWTTH